MGPWYDVQGNTWLDNSYTIINTDIYSELPTPLQLDVAELLLEEVLDRRLIKCANAS
jgi:hypothetical protein